MRKHWQATKKRLTEHSREILLAAGMMAVAVCGFEFGFVQGVKRTSPPIVIEKAVAAPTIQNEPVNASNAGATNAPSNTSEPTSQSPENKCPFVGSKNSDKYHAAGCAVVKRIKPENRVCFTSEDDARAKRYQPGCLK